MQSRGTLRSAGISGLPAEVVEDLGRGEEARMVAPSRLLRKPGDTEGMPGLAVLTTDRLIFLPGGRRPPSGRPTGSLLIDGFIELWSSFMRTPRGRVDLAARARPGVDVPLSDMHDFFLSRAPNTLGLTLSLPAPDPRPPWALYLELPDRATASAWAKEGATLRGASVPRPELSRPYALYYLRNPVPSPTVLVRGPAGVSRGVLHLGLDGPEIGGFRESAVLTPYEAIDRVDFAEPTGFRSAKLVLTSAGRVYEIEPRTRRGTDDLRDLAHLITEALGMEFGSASGPLRAGRLAVATATAGGIGALLWEILLQL